jgi:hypothetical protein
MDQWTPRVTARAELAELLLGPHLARAEAAGLSAGELGRLRELGRTAIEANRLQQEQLAEAAVQRTERALSLQDLFAREDALRDRLTAVAGDLTDSGLPTERALGQWLTDLSFARYRMRMAQPRPSAEARAAAAGEAGGAAGDDGAAPSELRSVVRVERADAVTRLNGLGAFCAALLRPGRERLVELFAARGLSADALLALQTDAQALADLGRNVRLPVDATAAEAEAAGAQRMLWTRLRRMLRKASLGVPELQRKLAEC